jgi:alpha-pyrone synthase
MTTAFINRIATAVPPNDVHQAFIGFATGMVPEGTTRNLFKRMARLSGIEHRYSFVQPESTEDGLWKDAEQVYDPGNLPITARRMKFFESFADRVGQTRAD